MSETVEKQVVKAETNRRTVRVPVEVDALIRYWADLSGVSENDFILDAVAYYVKYLVGDYDLPTAEQQRLAQIVDVVQHLEERVASLETVTVKGLNSLVSLARGDNYLLEEGGFA